MEHNFLAFIIAGYQFCRNGKNVLQRFQYSILQIKGRKQTKYVIDADDIRIGKYIWLARCETVIINIRTDNSDLAYPTVIVLKVSAILVRHNYYILLSVFFAYLI